MTQPNEIQTVRVDDHTNLHVLPLPYLTGNLVLLIADAESAGRLYEAMCEADPTLIMFDTNPQPDPPVIDKELPPDASHPPTNDQP